MPPLLRAHHEDTLPPQEVVNVFQRAFGKELYGSLEEVQSLVQKVKTDLYNRDYTAAFDDDTKRVAYCCRWSPARAVAYSSLFAQLQEVNQIVRCSAGDQRILCVGGGAGGELVALGSLFTPDRHTRIKSNNDMDEADRHTLNVHLVDIFDWNNVVGRLTAQIEESWLYNGQSQYFNIQFTPNDVLKMDQNQLQLSRLNLITLLFTTNELFSEDKTGSIRFLQALSTYCQPGCHLLITESAGSYSHITVGSKKFPIQFLIDTILLGKRGGKRGEETHGRWALVNKTDSTWYRGDPDVDYPMKLENMRFFFRLYKKL
ncbi:YLR063W [Zygosaccharomyces parabailii]|nr:YLR063W [Zygosaccharomyces parabailii]CDH13895.1 uncharacterized protein ZBAI_05681 [Zygosaccharomyces bailii ISA1307]